MHTAQDYEASLVIIDNNAAMESQYTNLISQRDIDKARYGCEATSSSDEEQDDHFLYERNFDLYSKNQMNYKNQKDFNIPPQQDLRYGANTYDVNNNVFPSFSSSSPMNNNNHNNSNNVNNELKSTADHDYDLALKTYSENCTIH